MDDHPYASQTGGEVPETPVEPQRELRADPAVPEEEAPEVLDRQHSSVELPETPVEPQRELRADPAVPEVEVPHRQHSSVELPETPVEPQRELRADPAVPEEEVPHRQHSSVEPPETPVEPQRELRADPATEATTGVDAPILLPNPEFGATGKCSTLLDVFITFKNTLSVRRYVAESSGITSEDVAQSLEEVAHVRQRRDLSEVSFGTAAAMSELWAGQKERQVRAGRPEQAEEARAIGVVKPPKRMLCPDHDAYVWHLLVDRFMLSPFLQNALTHRNPSPQGNSGGCCLFAWHRGCPLSNLRAGACSLLGHTVQGTGATGVHRATRDLAAETLELRDEFTCLPRQAAVRATPDPTAGSLLPEVYALSYTSSLWHREHWGMPNADQVKTAITQLPAPYGPVQWVMSCSLCLFVDGVVPLLH